MEGRDPRVRHLGGTFLIVLRREVAEGLKDSPGFGRYLGEEGHDRGLGGLRLYMTELVVWSW
jgi:hypothetical protein